MKRIYKNGITLCCCLIGLCFAIAGCENTNTIYYDSQITPLNEILISSREYQDTMALADNVTPAIVGISSSDGYGDSVGSGVCIASGGYILTNAHVITNPNYIVLHLSNGESGRASLVWQDESQDIAIIKTQLSIPYLSLAGIDDVRVGEDVVAVGTPLTLTLKHTFTKGIVSALNRTIKVTNLAGESYMQNLIQHDASLNPGNSGGPLINTRGEVVGINTLKISGGEGIGFAIPVKSIASALKNVTDNGEYITPYLGVYGFDSEIAAYYGKTNISKGVYVIDVSEKSPLNCVNFEKGDIITSFNGVNINNMLDLRDELFKCKCGDKVNIQYLQNGILKEIQIVLHARSN